MNIPQIPSASFDYHLPEDRIAKFPLIERNKSKLLVYKNNIITDDYFFNIADHIPQKYLLILNDTKVIPARIIVNKPTGASIEIFLLEPNLPSNYQQIFNTEGYCEWKCLLGNAKKWKENLVIHKTLIINSEELILTIKKIYSQKDHFIISFTWDKPIKFSQIINALGKIPIPPYLKRDTVEMDLERYQTIFSKIPGSVAAPTASLHFTENEFIALKNKGIDIAYLTLHIGAGTFKPIENEYISQHVLHTEYFEVNQNTIQKIIQYYPNIIAVGTTTLRAIESLYHYANLFYHNYILENDTIPQWCEYISLNKLNPLVALKYLIDNKVFDNTLTLKTQLMISPGYNIRMAEGLITNFHQPRSSLLALVSAFVGESWKNIYEHALKNNYRFLSYGDTSLLWKK